MSCWPWALFLPIVARAQSGSDGDPAVDCSSNIYVRHQNTLTCQLDIEDAADVASVTLCPIRNNATCMRGELKEHKIIFQNLDVIKTYKLNIQFANGETFNENYHLRTIVKPTAPWIINATFVEKSEIVPVFIGTDYPAPDYLAGNLIFELLITSAENTTLRRQVPYSPVYIEGSHLRNNTNYSVRVRARPNGDYFKGSWSEWSQPVCFQTPSREAVAAGQSQVMSSPERTIDLEPVDLSLGAGMVETRAPLESVEPEPQPQPEAEPVPEPQPVDDPRPEYLWLIRMEEERMLEEREERVRQHQFRQFIRDTLTSVDNHLGGIQVILLVIITIAIQRWHEIIKSSLWPKIPNPKNTFLQMYKPNKALPISFNPEVFSDQIIHLVDQIEAKRTDPEIPGGRLGSNNIRGQAWEAPTAWKPVDCDELRLALTPKTEEADKEGAQTTCLVNGSGGVRGGSWPKTLTAPSNGRREEPYITMSSFFNTQ
ncbi:hypothetical protein GJAV_G00047530 [Gymnothorax javanicus]|nr:hypothetical protein GJAV_G00047530 [Gymnothorax javanicus]